MQRRSCSVPAAAKSVIAVIGVMLTLVCCSTLGTPTPTAMRSPVEAPTISGLAPANLINAEVQGN